MKESRGLTQDQSEAFAREGVVRLPAAVAPAQAEAMLDALWRRLEARHGAARDRPETWALERPAQLTSRTDAFAAMASPQVRAVLDQLLGPGGWKTPVRWGVPLVTFPGFASRRDVPHRHWHLDLHATADPPRVARLFLLLSAARPGGGGTGCVAGSHRVLRDLARSAGRTLRSAEARKLLMEQEPWFAALMTRRHGEDRVARFMDEDGHAAGVAVRVCEMTGDPGDIYLMDPMMLHAMTPNVRDTPRMMLTEWVYGAD